MTHRDEAENLPSASSGEMWYQCPGSVALSREAPPETPSPEAQQGTDIAAAMESDDFTELDEQGRTIAENLKTQRAEALDRWQKQFDEPTAGLVTYSEERFWIRDGATRKKACSAKPDFAAVGRKAGMVLDEKTGYLRVTPTFRNIQARIQAQALYYEFRVPNVRAVISAYRFRGRVDPVDYDTTRLEESRRELHFNLWRTQQPYAPRVPGPWCRYCPAKTLCPEHASWALIPMVHTGSAPLKKQDAIAVAYKLDLAQLAYIRERKAMLENFLEAVDTRLKGHSDEELASVGLRRVPSGNIRVVPDIQKLWAVIHASGLMNDAEFRDCLEPVLGRIEAALVAKITKSTDVPDSVAHAAVQRILEPAIELKPKNPMLKPLKGDACKPEQNE